MAKADGGPAFPMVNPPGPPGSYDDAPGMSLRDYFAAKALIQPMLFAGEGDTFTAEAIARHCYRLADAMLAERAK